MASLKDKIAAARAEGYSDEEIFAELAKNPKVQEALGEYSPDELASHLGLSLTPPPQDPNPVTRYGKMIGGGLAAGAGEMIGLPGTLIDLTNSLVPDDWKQRPESPLLAIPTGEEIRSGLRTLGVSDRPEARPQNPGEKLVEDVATGVGAAVPLAFAGPVAALGSGAVSGAGGWGANQLFPGNPWAEAVGAVLGGFGGHSAVKMAERAGKLRTLTKTLDDADVALGTFLEKAPRTAFERENLAKMMARGADTAHDSALAGIEAGAIASEAAPRAAIMGVADALEPKALGWQDAGEALRANAREWFETELPKQLETAWAPVDAAIAGDAPVALGAFDQTLGQITRKAGAAQVLVDKLTPALPRQLRETLDKVLEGQGEGLVEGFTWNDARALRSALGEAMHDPRIMPTIGDKNLKALYAALTDDLRTTAKASGAGQAFDEANEASRGLFSIAEGPIAKVLDDSVSPGEMAKRLASRGQTDSTDLTTLRMVAPKGMNALAATALRTDESGKRLADWVKLTPETKAALIPDQAARTAIDSALFDLDDIARQVKESKAVAAAQRNMIKQTSRDDLAAWKVSQKETEGKLRGAAAEARDAVKAETQSDVAKMASNLGDIKRLGIGGAIGGTAGTLASNMLGLDMNAIAHSALGATALAAAPLVPRAIRATIEDPSVLRAPLVGVSAGNALMRDEGAAPR